jgi:hypothetical protein
VRSLIQDRRAQYTSLTLPHVSGELDRLMDQLPRLERLFPLRQFSILGLPGTPKVAWTSAIPWLAARPASAAYRPDLRTPLFPSAGRFEFAPRSARQNVASILQAPPLQVALRPLLFESKGVAELALHLNIASPASFETPLGAVANQDLPLASRVQYSVELRPASLKSTPLSVTPASTLIQVASPASFQTPLCPVVNQALPLAPTVLYSIAWRPAPPTAAVKPITPAPALESQLAAALPPLLLDVIDSLGGVVVPPAHKLPLAKIQYAEAATGAPLKVLVLPQPLRTLVVMPLSKLEPISPKPAIETLMPPPAITPQGEAPAASSGAGSRPDLRMNVNRGALASEPWWAHASGFWKHAPRDLKLLLFGIPLLIALALHPRLPKVRLTSGQPTLGISQAVQTQLASFRQTMAERAAVALDEDFRSGLDDWKARSGDVTDWSYDATGFVKPGPLALYAPSTGLTDYQLQFLGVIGKKSLSWVVRAQDFDNYYVVKLVERKGGPMPEIGVTRYAVINGKAQDRVDTRVAISARPEMMYLVRMDVKGNDFSMWVQDQMVDSWSDTRLPRGGVGFYSAKGEESRLRWVQITHQYDMLGRLCAYLAPSNFSN